VLDFQDRVAIYSLARVAPYEKWPKWVDFMMAFYGGRDAFPLEMHIVLLGASCIFHFFLNH